MEEMFITLTAHGFILMIILIILIMTLSVCLVKLYKLQKNSITDFLTDLYNRRHLEDILDQEIGRASRYKHELIVMFVDLDKFKIINDTLGHKVGDKVLKNVAKSLKKSTRPFDFIARPGGDEFIVLLPETSLESAKYVGNKLIQAIEAIPIENTSLTLSASIGICQFDPEDSSLDLIKEADEAMYEAKNGGRGRIHISPKSLKFLSGQT